MSSFLCRKETKSMTVYYGFSGRLFLLSASVHLESSPLGFCVIIRFYFPSYRFCFLITFYVFLLSTGESLIKVQRVGANFHRWLYIRQFNCNRVKFVQLTAEMIFSKSCSCRHEPSYVIPGDETECDDIGTQRCKVNCR